MKQLAAPTLGLASVALCLSLTLLPNHANATLVYWDPQYPNTTLPYTGDLSGNWDLTTANWNSSSGGAGTEEAFPNGAAVCFAVGSGLGTPAYTVNVAASGITFAGIFDGSLNPNSSDVTLTNNSLALASGEQGFAIIDASDGSKGIVTFDNVITGSGIMTMENYGAGGVLNLNAANTFTGGVELGYSGASYDGVLNFNNGSAFGTGTINLIWGSGSTLAAVGTSPITVNNNFTDTDTINTNASGAITATLNLVGNTAGVTYSGSWNVGANALTISTKNQVTISGPLSGSAALTKDGTGTLTLSGNNSGFTGTTTITAGTLELGVNGALGNSPMLIMNGGTLNPNGFSLALSAITLSLTANSTFDFSTAVSDLVFANSSGNAWTGILTVKGWLNGVDGIRFGTDATGLTAAQLNDIIIDDQTSGQQYYGGLDSGGNLIEAAPVPEPSTILLGALGGLGLILSRRRRA